MNLILRNRNGYPLPGSLRSTVFGNLLDTMLDDFMSPATSGTQDTAFSPRIDVVENDKGYQIEADLPGVAKNDLKVAIDGQRVAIEAEVRKEDTELIRQMLESMCWAARVMAISEDEAPGYFAAITAARARLEQPCA